MRSALFVLGGGLHSFLFVCLHDVCTAAPINPHTTTHHHTNSGFLFMLHPERDAYQTTTHQVRSGVSSQVLPASALLSSALSSALLCSALRFAAACKSTPLPFGGVLPQQIVRMLHQLMRVWWCGVQVLGFCLVVGAVGLMFIKMNDKFADEL